VHGFLSAVTGQVHGLEPISLFEGTFKTASGTATDAKRLRGLVSFCRIARNGYNAWTFSRGINDKTDERQKREIPEINEPGGAMSELNKEVPGSRDGGQIFGDGNWRGTKYRGQLGRSHSPPFMPLVASELEPQPQCMFDLRGRHR